ncbi:Glutathione peroxidase [Phytophthora infestans]|uniref:Glutathione peroxidase n=1 Tax=Phytophthora infestans TaxID=4787 RepID=A0A833W333_PHYIN|nr:Glutathione peroxidase [Phytophthora infestans]
MALQGRVFDLWRHFRALPTALQHDVSRIQTHLLSPEVKKQLFTRSTFPKVSGDNLLRVINRELEQQQKNNHSPEYTAKVADGLVQSGFLTPKKSSNLVENFNFKTLNSEFLAVGNGLADVKGKTEPFYVVVNDQSKNVYVFNTDMALESCTEINMADDATVEFSDAIQHGIKLVNPKITEIFSAENKEKQEEWLNSFINADAQYREVFNVEDTAKIKSFYELKDFNMAGNEVSMSKYKGKVVLAVNVSSKCGLTPTNYPELQTLYEKYKDEGLEVLAFPCNQFAGQEPGTHEEIMEFVKQYNVTFPFFEKHDVNGATARPVFTYLKTKLPGSFGDFVKWNFTKFLVDRNRQPYKRFAPKDRPLSLEEDIKTLLAQEE